MLKDNYPYKMLKIIASFLLFVGSSATSNQCFINESKMTRIDAIQYPEPIHTPINFTNNTLQHDLSKNEFKKCTLCTQLTQFRQLPEFTSSYGTDNPDTALLNQYRP
jgi:hypothetical protein